MAGKIVADTLEHSTAGSVTTDYVVNGSAKFWINQDNGTTIRDSYNCSSLTDLGVGQYQNNINNNMNNANYSPSTASFEGAYTSGQQTIQTGILGSGSFNTGWLRIDSSTTSGSVDNTRQCSQIVGDLA